MVKLHIHFTTWDAMLNTDSTKEYILDLNFLNSIQMVTELGFGESV